LKVKRKGKEIMNEKEECVMKLTLKTAKVEVKALKCNKQFNN
jgi:hypothetical protein